MLISKIRYSSLDVTRGFSFTLMILSDIPVLVSMGVIPGIAFQLASPFFLIVAGLSYEFFVSSRLKSGLRSREIALESFFRSILLLLIVMVPLYFGSLLYPNRFQFAFHWSIFQIIALGYLVGIVLKRNFKLEVFTVFLIFLFTFILKTYFFNWSKFFLTGQLPPFPYLAYFIFGRMLFEVYLYQEKSFNNMKLFIIAAIASLLIIWMLIINSFYLDRGDPRFFVLACSAMFLIIILSHIVLDKKKINIPFIDQFEGVGKIAFSSYYVFYVMELAIFPYINSHFLIKFTTLPLTIIYICSCVFIVFFLSFVQRIWVKYNYIFGVEWLLRSGVNGIMKFVKRSNAVRTKL